MDFDKRKQQVLLELQQAIDKSPKGSVDAPIIDLVNMVNGSHDYCTTSSCSGRISVFTVNPGQQKGGVWALVSHEEITLEQLQSCLTPEAKNLENADVSQEDEEKRNVGDEAVATFRYEPLILSIECRNLDCAATLLKLAQMCGLRESGITSVSHRFMVSIRSSLRLEVPITLEGSLLVPVSFLAYLVDLGNKKMQLNAQRTQSFADRFRQTICGLTESVQELPTVEDEGWSLMCPKQHVPELVEILRVRDWNDISRLTGKVSGGLIALPLNPVAAQACRRALQDTPLSNQGLRTLLGVEFDSLWIEKVALSARAIGVSQKERNKEQKEGSANKKEKVDNKPKRPPGPELQAQIAQLLTRKGLDPSLLAEVPTRWEMLGDIVILPSTAFASEAWSTVYDELWPLTASCLRANKVGRQQEITADLMRQSQVKMLLGETGEVTHKENGIIYQFDVTKSMFSSGNGTEKMRMAQICGQNDVVVDLYAGIGYFTIPFLVHGKAKHVHACELNPNSVAALRKSLAANKVEDRCTVYPGDNRLPSLLEHIANCADRVSLGLLPSSEEGWPIGLAALKSSGGTLHIHANVKEHDEKGYGENMLERLKELARASETRQDWEFAIKFVSRVKSYGPHVNHLVYDVHAGPPSGLPPVNLVLPPSTSAVRGAVEVACNISCAQFASIMAARRPVLIRGSDTGAARERWSPSYLQSHGPCDRPVSVHVAPEKRMNYCAKNYLFQMLPFPEFIARASGQTSELSTEQRYFVSPFERYYFRGLGPNPRARANFFSDFPGLAEDFKFPAFFDAMAPRVFSSVFRAGSADLQLWTHYDITDNILCQISGTKRVVLFPPDVHEALYLPNTSHSSSSPVVDIDNPDLSEFPLFPHAQSKAIECILNPGDVLYIPALWFHNVLSLDFSVSINVFFKELEDPFYQKKDIFGNQDLILGANAMQLTQEAQVSLGGLPTYFQDFYRSRCRSILACDAQK